jgi:hypothetical protein
MPVTQPGFFAAIGSTLLVTDLIFLYSAFLRGAYWPGGYTPSAYALPAAASGLIISLALSRSLSPRRRIAVVAGASVCWAVAGLLGDWANTEAILGARDLPQWWITVIPGPGCAYGLAFFSGQLIPGTVAGLGAAGPVVLNPELTRVRRGAWSLGLLIVTAVAWMATFHGRWAT